jgi:hypothetical protein
LLVLVDMGNRNNIFFHCNDNKFKSLTGKIQKKKYIFFYKYII